MQQYIHKGDTAKEGRTHGVDTKKDVIGDRFVHTGTTTVKEARQYKEAREDREVREVWAARAGRQIWAAREVRQILAAREPRGSRDFQ